MAAGCLAPYTCLGNVLSPQWWLFVFVLLCTFNMEEKWVQGQSSNWCTQRESEWWWWSITCQGLNTFYLMRIRAFSKFDVTGWDEKHQGFSALTAKAEHNVMHDMKRQSHIQRTGVCVCVSGVPQATAKSWDARRRDPVEVSSLFIWVRYHLSTLCLTSSMLKRSHMAVYILSFQTPLRGCRKDLMTTKPKHNMGGLGGVRYTQVPFPPMF